MCGRVGVQYLVEKIGRNYKSRVRIIKHAILDKKNSITMVTHPVLFLTWNVIGEKSLKILYIILEIHAVLHDSAYNRTQTEPVKLKFIVKLSISINCFDIKYVCIPSNDEIS